MKGGSAAGGVAVRRRAVTTAETVRRIGGSGGWQAGMPTTLRGRGRGDNRAEALNQRMLILNPLTARASTQRGGEDGWLARAVGGGVSPPAPFAPSSRSAARAFTNA